MKFLLVVLFSTGIASSVASSLAASDAQGNATHDLTISAPQSAHGQMWKYVKNNAIRIADEYASIRKPSATFAGSNQKIDFIRQYEGEHKDRHLLIIVNSSNGITSLATLLPLFDENASSENLDDERPLWRVLNAKYNGQDF